MIWRLFRRQRYRVPLDEAALRCVGDPFKWGFVYSITVMADHAEIRVTNVSLPPDYWNRRDPRSGNMPFVAGRRRARPK